MNFQYSVEWLLGGIALVVVGALIVVFYRVIADNLINGAASYDGVKLFGVIVIAIGLVCVANLHLFVLNFIANLLFGNRV